MYKLYLYISNKVQKSKLKLDKPVTSVSSWWWLWGRPAGTMRRSLPAHPLMLVCQTWPAVCLEHNNNKITNQKRKCGKLTYSTELNHWYTKHLK